MEAAAGAPAWNSLIGACFLSDHKRRSAEQVSHTVGIKSRLNFSSNRSEHRMSDSIPFVRPYLAGDEEKYVLRALRGRQLASDGQFTTACAALLEKRFKIQKVLMTPSCTAALEMAAAIVRLGPRRRSDSSLVHVRFDRQCDRAAGSQARVRRHSARHVQHRRNADRGRNHAAHEGHLSGALRRHRLRDGANSSDRRETPITRGGRRRPGSERQLFRPRTGFAGPTRLLQLPRDEELYLRRGGRAVHQRSDARRARGDHPREGNQPQPVFARASRQIHLGRSRRLALAE